MTTWLNAAEAAVYLRVSHRTVLLWAKTKRIPAHKLSGAARITWRFCADELDAFMSNGTGRELEKHIV